MWRRRRGWRHIARHHSSRVDRGDLIPAQHLRPLKVAWVPRTFDQHIRARDHRAMLDDPYYLQELTALFGTVGATPTPAPCRLCAGPALQVRGLAYCFGCCRRAQRGTFPDSGGNGTWVATVLWAIERLVDVEFSGPPSRAQLTRLSVLDPDQADQAMLCRILLARADPEGGRPRSGESPRTWTQWLQLAGHLEAGIRNARGITTIATDGHLCRSLFERHIDDFLHHNGIIHETEPHYPWNEELNTTGLRADWRLADGTFVEALGFPNDRNYMAKVQRKILLAERFGISLVALTASDLHRLPDLFRDWLPGGSSSRGL